jgi:hypothetical protein
VATAVYLTIDTEYAAHLPGAGRSPGTRAENFARSIACDTPAGAVGIFHQMDLLDAHGLKGVFFVDPMPALLWGVAAIEDVVGPIVARGHDVQLHCHTEWLEHAPGNPLTRGRTGRNLKDFGAEDQARIIEFARGTLVSAGAPSPIAFRAGNYGANDDTLRALAMLGLAYDTSHGPALSGTGDCAISLGADHRLAGVHHGVIEVPIACIETFGKRLRHGQVTALSRRELIAALIHARDTEQPSVTLVSHSFELLSRDRRRINRLVERRFRRFCEALAALPGVTSATYASAPPELCDPGREGPVLRHDPLRGGARVVEQALANALYSRSLRLGAHHALAMGTVLLT